MEDVSMCIILIRTGVMTSTKMNTRHATVTMLRAMSISSSVDAITCRGREGIRKRDWQDKGGRKRVRVRESESESERVIEI